MSARARLERSCLPPSDPTLIADLDAYRDEVLAEAAQSGIPRSRDRKVGYIVAQHNGSRLMVEAFREVDGKWAPSHVMTATTAKELADEFFEALMSLGGESRG